MPTTITTVEVAYTLSELDQLEGDYGAAYQNAIEKIVEWVNMGGDYVQFITEDLGFWLEVQPHLSYTEVLSWDYDRQWENNFRADVNVASFMQERKLHTKYRALWYAMKHLGCFDSTVGVIANEIHHIDHALEDWERDLDRYTDLYDEDRKRYDLIMAQIAEVGAAITAYVDDLLSEYKRIVNVSIDYRYSEEFAKEEAEALELYFDEEGNILRI